MDFSSTTLGILGGMGPAATANFYRLLVAELNRIGVFEDSAFPRTIMLSIPLRDWDYTGARNKTTVASQVRQGIGWLESFGAKLVAVPCNSVHEFIEASSVVSIVDATLARCASAEVVGVLCSRQTREAKLYERNPAQRYVYVSDQDFVDSLITRVLSGARPSVYPCTDELIASGAEAIVIGCTELSLCYFQSDFVPVVDSAESLASAVVSRLIAVCSPDRKADPIERRDALPSPGREVGSL